MKLKTLRMISLAAISLAACSSTNKTTENGSVSVIVVKSDNGTQDNFFSLVEDYSKTNSCDQHLVRDIDENIALLYDYAISESKYKKITKTLSSYISHSGMSENEQREFIYDLCDTTARILYPLFFKYSSQINGFDVEGKFYLTPGDPIHPIHYFATLYFSSDSLVFEIMHPTFRPSSDGFPDTLKPLDCIELVYNKPRFPNPSRISLDSIHNLPFAFIDIDFDGKKELLLSHPGVGQRETSVYSAYLLPNIKDINPFEDYTWSELDDFTEIDYSTQTVISSFFGGFTGSKWYFRYDGERLKPYLKEEYTHWLDSLENSISISE